MSKQIVDETKAEFICLALNTIVNSCLFFLLNFNAYKSLNQSI